MRGPTVQVIYTTVSNKYFLKTFSTIGDYNLNNYYLLGLKLLLSEQRHKLQILFIF